MRFWAKKIAAGLLLVSWAPAFAQAPPPPPPPMMMTGDLWSGLYAGANLGLAFEGGNSYSLSPTGCFVSAVAPCGGGVANNAFRTFGGTDNGSGFVAGLQLGYNWMLGPSFLLGVETDFEYDGASSNTTVRVPALSAPLVGSAAYEVNQSQDYLGTIRGRLGFLPTPSLLLYGTGGFAYGNPGSKTYLNFTATTDTYLGSSSGVKTGWTAGGGAEWMLAPQWTVRAEYLYVDLGSSSYTDGCTTAPVCAGLVPAAAYHTSISNNEHVVRLAFNYHFNAPPPPPPAPAAMPAPPPAAPKVFIVFFDWDKDTITKEGAAIIAQAADAYKSGAPVQLQVTGYTDRSGSPGYNQRLSERRANNVARALAALGVPREQMVVSGRGENDNRVPTAPGVREPQNRRVEIIAP